jgi:hypothetical protein
MFEHYEQLLRFRIRQIRIIILIATEVFKQCFRKLVGLSEHVIGQFQDLQLQRSTHTENHAYTSYPRSGTEPVIPVLYGYKSLRTTDRMIIEIGPNFFLWAMFIRVGIILPLILPCALQMFVYMLRR